MSELFSRAAFALLAVAAAGMPLVRGGSPAQPSGPAAPWPAQFEGRALAPLAPAPEDRALAAQFPGNVARFSDGRRQVVLRQVPRATRRLHPARDCFRASGWAIEPAPMRLIAGRGPASCFLARRQGRTLRACERIESRAGESWPDVSSWYWSALFSPDGGPWLASLTVEETGA